MLKVNSLAVMDLICLRQMLIHILIYLIEMVINGQKYKRVYGFSY